MIRLTILGNPPSKANSYRASGKKFYKASKVGTYERSFSLQCNYKGDPIDDRFLAVLDVYVANAGSDLDNTFKVIFDCLQSNGIIKNDNKCYKIIATKHVDKKNPRVEIVLESLNKLNIEIISQLLFA